MFGYCRRRIDRQDNHTVKVNVKFLFDMSYLNRKPLAHLQALKNRNLEQQDCYNWLRSYKIKTLLCWVDSVVQLLPVVSK